MGKYIVKLNCQLSFDDNTERDIVAVIDRLNKSRMTGRFISNVIKTMLQSPESIAENNGLSADEIVAKYCKDCKVSYDRKAYVREIAGRLESVKSAVDAIYEAAMKDFIYATVSEDSEYKNLAKEKIKLASELEMYTESIRKEIGVKFNNPVYESSKVRIAEGKVNEYLKLVKKDVTKAAKTSDKDESTVERTANNAGNKRDTVVNSERISSEVKIGNAEKFMPQQNHTVDHMPQNNAVNNAPGNNTYGAINNNGNYPVQQNMVNSNYGNGYPQPVVNNQYYTGVPNSPYNGQGVVHYENGVQQVGVGGHAYSSQPQPVVSQPVVGQPVVGQPVVGQPVVGNTYNSQHVDTNQYGSMHDARTYPNQPAMPNVPNNAVVTTQVEHSNNRTQKESIIDLGDTVSEEGEGIDFGGDELDLLADFFSTTSV